jgi:hypothetical protein
MSELRIELDDLTPDERRDLANALLRAAWSAALGETRIRCSLKSTRHSAETADETDRSLRFG